MHRRIVFGHLPIFVDRASVSANRQLKADLADGLTRAVAEAGPGVDARASLREGDPAAVLAAESEHLGLLVVGSRGYGPIGSVLLGSVAGKLLDTAACPVMVIPRSHAPRPVEHPQRSATGSTVTSLTHAARSMG